MSAGKECFCPGGRAGAAQPERCTPLSRPVARDPPEGGRDGGARPAATRVAPSPPLPPIPLLSTFLGPSPVHPLTRSSVHPMTMRAAIFHEHGGPEVVRIEQVLRPDPGDGQVLVKVRAVGHEPPGPVGAPRHPHRDHHAAHRRLRHRRRDRGGGRRGGRGARGRARRHQPLALVRPLPGVRARRGVDVRALPHPGRAHRRRIRGVRAGGRGPRLPHPRRDAVRGRPRRSPSRT